MNEPFADLLQASLERGREELMSLAPIPLSDVPTLSQPTDRLAQFPGFTRSRQPETRRLHPFEVFIVGYTDGDATTARVQVGTGTILPGSGTVAGIQAITGKDSTFEVTDGDWIWLALEFDAAGAITSCTLTSGAAWTGFPVTYVKTGDTNTWFHPIAQIRASLGDKIGEHPIMADAVIAQKTNTHLVVKRECVDGVKIYLLAPGIGGDDTP